LDDFNIRERDFEAISSCMKNVKSLAIGGKFGRNVSLKGFEMLTEIINVVSQPVSFNTILGWRRVKFVPQLVFTALIRQKVFTFNHPEFDFYLLTNNP